MHRMDRKLRAHILIRMRIPAKFSPCRASLHLRAPESQMERSPNSATALVNEKDGSHSAVGPTAGGPLGPFAAAWGVPTSCCIGGAFHSTFPLLLHASRPWYNANNDDNKPSAPATPKAELLKTKAAMEAKLPTMEGELSTMEAKLATMKAALVKDACPHPQFVKWYQLWSSMPQAELQGDIRAQQGDIRAQQGRIDALQGDIRGIISQQERLDNPELTPELLEQLVGLTPDDKVKAMRYPRTRETNLVEAESMTMEQAFIGALGKKSPPFPRGDLQKVIGFVGRENAIAAFEDAVQHNIELLGTPFDKSKQ